jgi:hypothetical protein
MKTQNICTRKAVINTRYGGFGLSDFAIEELAKVGVKYDWSDNSIRTNTELVNLLEKYGTDAISGDYAYLKIIMIPDAENLPEFDVLEYDGIEQIVDSNRIWS